MRTLFLAYSLNTVLPYNYREKDVKVAHHVGEASSSGFFDGNPLSELNRTHNITKTTVQKSNEDITAFYNAALGSGEITLDFTGNIITTPTPNPNTTYTTKVTFDGTTKLLSTLGSYKDGNGNKVIVEYFVDMANYVVGEPEPLKFDVTEKVTSANKFYDNRLYNEIKQEIKSLTVNLPPSSTIAGVYATVDNTRGVWKSPANISLKYVQGPSHLISSAEQENMNVTISGKSVNAIRAFAGKGTLVWGGRTLAGNDNEWRYVSVRRFFNMIEESVKKASEKYVFENNDASTWLQVRVMIENFLTLQWRAGALQGAKTDDAFFVRVGLGETMTAQDILEGRMIVEIGMAVVRPAEFIILRFSHKLVES